MYSGSAILVLAFLAWAHAKQSKDTLVDKLVEKLVDQALKSWPLHQTDLDMTTLEKAPMHRTFQQAIPSFNWARHKAMSTGTSSRGLSHISYGTSKYDSSQRHDQSAREASFAKAPGLTSRRASLLAGISSWALQNGAAHAELKDYVLDGLGEEGIVDLSVGLGNAQNANVFEPNHLELTQGVLYRLRLKNYGMVSHNFAAPDFIDRSFSILVRTGGGEGEDPLVEVKGPGIRVVGMKAGGRADWYLMPVRTGKYDFKCTVPGHEGMKGIITVRASSPERKAER